MSQTGPERAQLQLLFVSLLPEAMQACAGTAPGQVDVSQLAVGKKFSAVTSTRLSLAERACRMAVTACPASSSTLDRDPVVASLRFRGQSAKGRTTCGSRIALLRYRFRTADLGSA